MMKYSSMASVVASVEITITLFLIGQQMHSINPFDVQPQAHPRQLSTRMIRSDRTSWMEQDNIEPKFLNSHEDQKFHGIQERRDVLSKGLTFGCLVAATLTTLKPSIANAKSIKSRTSGYEIQHTEAEWSELLSPRQYFVLRDGGTEAPYSSILEPEARAGLYVCAGCQTPLFDSHDKFHSGTGWPSFASPVMSSRDPNQSYVEMEEVSSIQYKLAGAEVRCKTCGGHLGDVFADGFLFVGTPAYVTGKRYCIDGSALLFVPYGRNSGVDATELDAVQGDEPPKGRQ